MWFALALVLPLLWATALATTQRGDGAWRRVTGLLIRGAPVALVPAGVLAVLAPDPLTLDWLVRGTTLAVDVVSRALFLVAVLLYGAAVQAVTWRLEDRAAHLIAALLTCFVGNALVYLAHDTITFYLGFALMSFGALWLVLHERSEKTARAGRVYLALTVVSETAILAALLLIDHAGARLVEEVPAAVAASDQAGLIVGLLIAGFGVKAGLVPLHFWLPLAHPAAPPPASAVLSGAMVKAGLIGWLRFLPLGEAEMPATGTVLTVLALFGAFAAVLVGAVQRDPKAVLAYSTISQMGFLGAVVGVALARPDLAGACITAALIYAVHHGLAKGALFLGVSVWKRHASPQTPGRRLVVVAGLVLASLAVVGSPLSAGSVGKYAAKEAIKGATILEVEPYDLLPWVATGSTLLLLRFAWILRGSDTEPTPERSELTAWSVLVLTSVSVPWLLSGAWVPLSDVPGLDPVTLWDATWPVLVGLAVGGLVWLLARRRDWSAGLWRDRLPVGDVVVPVEAASRGLGRAAGQVVAGVTSARDRVVEVGQGLGRRLEDGGSRVEAAEEALGWRVSGLLILVTILVLVAAAVAAGALGGRIG
ncbi:MAG: complex I subunit 5 family protein [Mobilicoccus sp.]|nr:complex I subunit 5 family protein [Mobilicoccus sp.]